MISLVDVWRSALQLAWQDGKEFPVFIPPSFLSSSKVGRNPNQRVVTSNCNDTRGCQVKMFNVDLSEGLSEHGITTKLMMESHIRRRVPIRPGSGNNKVTGVNQYKPAHQSGLKDVLHPPCPPSIHSPTMTPSSQEFHWHWNFKWGIKIKVTQAPVALLTSLLPRCIHLSSKCYLK